MDLSNTTLGGRYLLGPVIGTGGMSDVYAATDELLGRDIAVKMMRADLARDETFLERFRREAKNAAKLNHHAIVAVYDTGQTDEAQGSVPYIVMERVHGQTLRDIVSDNGPLPLNEAGRIMAEVCRALSFSHEAGIIHRDIKPANIMITNTGAVKVMDFGIARALSDTTSAMTQTAAVIGTAQYLSPEQARGEQVDSRSDLYSVGCLLFELLTGRPPFVGDSPVSVAYQHVREEPPVASAINPEISPALDSVLAKALAKDVDARFQSGEEFRAALAAAHQHSTLVTAAGSGAEDHSDDDAATTVLAAGAVGAGESDVARTQAFSAVQGSSSGQRTGHDDTLHGHQLAAHREPGANPDHHDGHDGHGGHDDDAVSSVMTSQNARDIDQRERKSNKRIIIAIVMILLALGAVAGGWWVMNEINQRNIEANQVTVPEVVEMTQTDAQNELTRAGLRPIVQEVHDDEVPRGQAVGTDPEAGEIMQRDEEVTLNMSLGPDQVVLPEDLQGASEATARDTLEELGVSISSVDYVNSATIERDRLVSTNPELGSTVAYGSSVALQMSSGQVEVPSLMGMTATEAEAALDELSLGVQVEETEAESAPGSGFDTVTDQSHAAGAAVDQGTTIRVTITIEAPEPDPEPTESPSPTESDDEESPSPDESDEESPSPDESDDN